MAAMPARNSRRAMGVDMQKPATRFSRRVPINLSLRKGSRVIRVRGVESAWDHEDLPSFARPDSRGGCRYRRSMGLSLLGILWAKQNAPDSLLSLGRLLISPPPS